VLIQYDTLSISFFSATVDDGEFIYRLIFTVCATSIQCAF